MVRLHPVGTDYSVLREWSHSTGAFNGWYVNLETSWVRTPVGFDSRDNVLDLVVDDACERWDLKDEDELAFALEVGTMSAQEADLIRSAAELAGHDIDRRAWPFREATWDRLRPSDVGVPELPVGWSELS